jgi:hypothetical protein
LRAPRNKHNVGVAVDTGLAKQLRVILNLKLLNHIGDLSYEPTSYRY